MASSAARTPQKTQTLRVLVVDDEKDMLDFLERVFRRDCDVRRASSVEEALGVLDSGPIDVIITDRRMPKQSGLELLEMAAKRQPDAARILLTGYADSIADGRVDQWSLVDAWVSKPIDSASLRQTVAELVNKR